MIKKNFHVSIKTIDDKPLFPPMYDGQKLLFPFVMQTSLRAGVMSIGFASFPTGVEIVAQCKDQNEVKKFADTLSSLICEHNNAIGYIIETFSIQIGELDDDEQTLHAFMTDMMMRSMVARGELSEVSDSSDDSDNGLFHIDIDLSDLDNSKITPLGKSGKEAAGSIGPRCFKPGGKKRFS